MEWKTIDRPGFFGRKRDEKIAEYNRRYGKENWRLRWSLVGTNQTFDFAEACVLLYEASYFYFLRTRSADIDFICSFTEVIDNATTNILSGFDYTKQEAYSTHIQDIAVRNVIRRVGRCFEGIRDEILTIRGNDPHGGRFNPGHIPFLFPELIPLPQLHPQWAEMNSVEAYWQSGKVLQIRE